MSLTFLTVTNPVYTNSEGTGIDVQVTFAEIQGTHNFHATSWDSEEHGLQLYNDLKSGKYGAIAPYTQDLTKQPSNIRNIRNNLLAETDWTQAPDVTQEVKNKWLTYRQALRDVPQQNTFPTSVTWPTKPE